MSEAPRLELHQDWLRLFFDHGYADFHYRWLRHNSDGDRHPTTGERTLCSSELRDDLSPVSAVLLGDKLHVRWNDGSSPTHHELSWLAENAYSKGRQAPPDPPNLIPGVELTWSAPAEIGAPALARVREDGVVVARRKARGAPPEEETDALIEAFQLAGLKVIETHFGRIEDLRTDNTTNKNTDQLGYTDAPIQLHTDQPFLQSPPRYQLLQSIRSASSGGDNFLVDGRAAARSFAALEKRDFELLTSVPIRFHRKQKSFESQVVSPLIVDGPEGFQIRSSYFTMAPHQVSFDLMSAWYRAFDRFSRYVRDEKNQLRFKLSPGDFVFYDNFRMLHARTAFEGARWVRGVYFNESVLGPRPL